jgi:hypothetical protein
MNIVFDDPTIPFKYNKIIFSFEKIINDSDEIQTVGQDFDFEKINQYNYVGYVKMYTDNNNVKFFDINIPSRENFKISFRYIKDFLIKSIYELVKIDDNIDNSNFCIYWEPGIITNKDHIDILKEIDIYIDAVAFNKYRFTKENIRTYKARNVVTPVQKSFTFTSSTISTPTSTNNYFVPSTPSTMFGSTPPSTNNYFGPPTSSTTFGSTPTTTSMFGSKPGVNTPTYNPSSFASSSPFNFNKTQTSTSKFSFSNGINTFTK